MDIGNFINNLKEKLLMKTLRNRYNVAAIIAAFVFIIALLPQAACAEPTEKTADSEKTAGWPGDLDIITGPKGGQWNALGMKMAELLNEAGIPA